MKAVLLDLDGVITDTARLHAACWKQMFDEYLQKRATRLLGFPHARHDEQVDSTSQAPDWLWRKINDGVPQQRVQPGPTAGRSPVAPGRAMA